jgi:hypothetical protein
MVRTAAPTGLAQKRDQACRDPQPVCKWNRSDRKPAHGHWHEHEFTYMVQRNQSIGRQEWRSHSHGKLRPEMLPKPWVVGRKRNVTQQRWHVC